MILHLVMLFVLSFKNEDDRTSYYKYCMPSVFIDGNAFFELPLKNLGETYEKIIQIVVTTQELIY